MPSYIFAKRGASALAVVLIMTAIVLEVTVASLVVSDLLSSTMGTEQASLEALEIAKSGAEDAIVRVNRYIDCPDTVYCPSSYSLTVGSGEVCVNITGDAMENEQLVIYSRGTIQNSQKFVEAIISVVPADAFVKVRSLKEVENPGVTFDDSGC